MPGGQAMFDWMYVYTKFYGVPTKQKRIPYGIRSWRATQDSPCCGRSGAAEKQSTGLFSYTRPSNPRVPPNKTKTDTLRYPLMARHAGFEPATYRFVAGHSIH